MHIYYTTEAPQTLYFQAIFNVQTVTEQTLLINDSSGMSIDDLGVPFESFD